MYYKGPLVNGLARKIKPGSIKHIIQAREKYWFSSKDATKPSGKERTLLKQYEILTAGNLEKLIKRKTYDGECYVDTVRLGHPDQYRIIFIDYKCVLKVLSNYENCSTYH
jgi:hypothetical protein